jgi:hypothetical protein
MIEQAKAELLSILLAQPQGMFASELSRTKEFHGARKLSNRQIIKLLRSMPHRVQENAGGQGNRTYLLWKVKPTKEAR